MTAGRGDGHGDTFNFSSLSRDDFGSFGNTSNDDFGAIGVGNENQLFGSSGGAGKPMFFFNMPPSSSTVLCAVYVENTTLLIRKFMG